MLESHQERKISNLWLLPRILGSWCLKIHLRKIEDQEMKKCIIIVEVIFLWTMPTSLGRLFSLNTIKIKPPIINITPKYHLQIANTSSRMSKPDCQKTSSMNSCSTSKDWIVKYRARQIRLSMSQDYLEKITMICLNSLTL